MATPSVSSCLLLAPILLAGLGPMAYAASPAGTAEVTLGGFVYRWPLIELDGPDGPPPRGPVELSLLAPSMTPRSEGIRTRGGPSMQAMLHDVPITIESPEGITVNAMLERKLVNDDRSVVGSLERRDPRERLELRVQQPEQWGLSPSTINEQLMDAYARDYLTRYGKALPRSPAFESDWYIARAANGRVGTFISCDRPHTALPVSGGQTAGDPAANDGAQLANCIHYFIVPGRKLFIQMSYQQSWLKDWKHMEDGVRAMIGRYEVR
ncbi:hypothetical protein [Stenotrophomonas chelatiphaga]|uniref:hypothetical protein n=1 Tax=Stenotrophomonas chelatiphaga TaxID=517011 RepID=UPI0028A21B50|nr:hypothetical protein [Stenotrophomonas chelatiphaga]